MASVLRARSISPFALAESTHLSFETISNMLEGKQDIGSIDSTLIEAYLGGNKPERWSDHQEIHNAWKKQQILRQCQSLLRRPILLGIQDVHLQ